VFLLVDRDKPDRFRHHVSIENFCKEREIRFDGGNRRPFFRPFVQAPDGVGRVVDQILAARI
jgi:hypothetical protein